MKYGYARVSTIDQNLSLQIDALEKAGCEQIFQDAGVSGAQRNRPQLNALMSVLQEGDQVVVWKLDRLGRSLQHLIETVSSWGERGIHFQSLSDCIDTTTAGGELQFHILGALAQFERSLISERTKAGMAAAKARGASVGRPKAMSSERVQYAREMIDSGKTQREAARVLKVSPSTLFRHLRASEIR